MDFKQMEFGDQVLKVKDEEARKTMTGATASAAGKAGQAPAPPAGDANRYLRSDGTWAVPPDTKRIANKSDDYILGIVSGAPFVLGNGDCDVWNGMYLRDEFTRIIQEPSPAVETVYVFEDGYESTEPGREPEQEYIKMPKPVPKVVRTYRREVKDENGNTVYSGTRFKLNPDYDPSQIYISRLDRPEWAPVGMLGVLSVIQDGTLEENGYCMCSDNGIATKCDLPG